MSIDNLVVFKGSIDGVIVFLDQEAPFEEILRSFEDKLKSSRKFFDGAKVSMKFKGRSLQDEEQDKILKLLANQNILDISFVHDFSNSEQRSKEEEVQWIMSQLAHQNTSFTYFHYGVLRSGQEINYKGSVVVLGDVNPGAIIRSDDNIIILGNLKGKAHAGLNPSVKVPFVLAFGMYPVQIGIKNIVAQSPDEAISNKKDSLPQIAYVNDEQIYVEEIDFKTLNHMIE